MSADPLAVLPIRRLPFYTPQEIAGMTLSAPDWIVLFGLLAVGAITEIDGKIKAAGKTTLILWMIRAILDGLPFLGQPTRQARVIYVTKQSRQTFADALRRAGLDQRGDELQILFREDIGITPGPKVVEACEQDGYEVVVFDTIGKLAGIRDENSAGEWSAAMSPIQDLAASGRAVTLARHDRKGGGAVGDSGRGSSQASGDVDIILALRRPEGNQPGARRVIESLSRYPETPDKMLIELTQSGYVLLGTTEAVATADARLFVSSVLGSEFQKTDIQLTRTRLEELGKKHDPKVAAWAITAALKAMEDDGKVRKSGRGVAGDPFVYAPPETASPESYETQTYIDRQTFDLRGEAIRIFGDDLVATP